MLRFGTITWQQRELGRARPPAALRPWLYLETSLTAKIRAACAGSVGVEVLGEDWKVPALDEVQLLAGGLQQRAWVREVALHCDGRAWVQARTVIPCASLTGSLRQLRRLGGRPLGEVVFSARRLERRCLQVGRVEDPGTGRMLWGRRSLLAVDGKPLLIAEMFLPALDYGRAYAEEGERRP